MYTPEQEEKIAQLRADREKEKEKKIHEKNHNEFVKSQRLKVGRPVFVTVEGKTVSGYIVKQHDNWRFDAKTPHGIVKNLSILDGEIRGRLVQDLSHVEIPDEVKKCTTSKLLHLLGLHRKCSYWQTPQFTEEQIKAELRNRPHVPTKREKRIYAKRISS